ncbi:MAG: DMT family transporter [Thermovirgaceae bacterium]|nr:DMT family transporter [Thermovirgaceae bacterium]
MKERIRIDFLAVLTAGVLWGTLSPAGKRLGMLGTDMLTVGVLRAVIMTIGVGFFLALYAPRFFKVSGKQLFQIALIAGPCMVGIYAGFFFALQYLSVPMTIVLFFTHPLLTTIGSLVITRETPNRYQVSGALLTLAGVAIGVFPQEGSFLSSVHPVGLAWVMFAAVGMSLYSLFGRLSAQSGFVPQPTLFFYIQAFGLVWLSIVKTFGTGWGNILLLSLQQVGLILYVGLIGSLLGYSIYFYSLRTIQASTASIVSSIEIVTAFALSAIMFGQPPALQEMVGAMLIILAIVLVSRKKKNPRAAR